MNKKLLMVVDTDWFFLSHRLPIALAAKNAGFDVAIVTTDTGLGHKIEEAGLRCIRVNFSRDGINPIKELNITRILYNIYRKEKPHIVHHVAIKMIMNGSLAAKFSGVKNVVNAVAGLGHFIDPQRRVLFAIISPIFKFIKSIPNLIYIYQNFDDRDAFVNNGWVKPEQIKIIRGSGIDLNHFAYKEEPVQGPVRILCATRLLWEKGLEEFVEAARVIKRKYTNGEVVFLIAGKVVTESPTSVKLDTIENWVKEGVIEYLGYQTDVYSCIVNSHINVLPSYYNEGLPKSLIEACATGRPIVTTDHTGCRETVDEGVNGFLVEKKNVPELADAISQLIENKDLRIRMGRASRRKAEEEFSIEKVQKETLAIYYSFNE